MGFAALLCGVFPASAQISLGTAASFGVLGGSAVTNTGSSVITGNLGVSPGTSCTGFDTLPCFVIIPGPGQVIGAMHVADAVALQAQSDNTLAYLNLASRGGNLTAPQLGGLT